MNNLNLLGCYQAWGMPCAWYFNKPGFWAALGHCNGHLGRQEVAVFDERTALALPSLAGYELFDALSKARDLGFRSVMGLPGGPRTRHSLGEFPTFGLYGADGAHTARLRRALAGFRHISMHQAWDSDWEAWLHCATAVRAEVLTVHAGLPRDDPDREAAVTARGTAIRRIGACAGEMGIRVGVENEGGSREEYLALIDRVDHASVGATIDVGHCACFDAIKGIGDLDERVDALNALICDLVDALGDRLFHLHVHDVRQDGWRDHRSVGRGIVDFGRLFRRLGGIGYSGLFDVELEEADREAAAAETGTRLTELCQSLAAPSGR